ncbi:MAG: enoyl-CoA hydratase-related protein [Phycisphaerales bacterium]|nr:enoyl-CoA hydratase-related protein [Phycisphaerales bacterium]
MATLILNQPEVLNPLSNSMIDGINQCLEQIESDHSIRVLIITGAGRGFCAGYDLSQAAGVPVEEFESRIEAANEASEEKADTNFDRAIKTLSRCPVPTITAINGPAAGGGLGLALLGDVTIAARSAFFVATFNTVLGIVPDLCVSWNVPRRVGRARALGSALLGHRITAEQAEDWGLIWKAVEDDELMSEANRIAGELKRTSPETVTRTRRLIDASLSNEFDAHYELEIEHQNIVRPKNMKIGADAFMEKRKPVFDGTREW